MDRPRRAPDLLSPEEIRELTRASDLAGAIAVLSTWSIIAGAFALVAWRPHPLTIAIALVVLGGRHMALGVLVHESAHRSLFASRRLGAWVGTWLCAAPSGNHVELYRAHHLAHHAHAGTPRDPDRSLIDPFPVTRASMARKLLRDLTGLTGLRRVVAVVLMDLGVLRYTAAASTERIDQRGRTATDVLRCAVTNLGPTLLANAVLLGILVALGHAELYLLWVASYLTTYSLFLRIRSIAEHACTEEGDDPFLNTRTTRANWLARLTVAPHGVNHHLEHHLLMTVPYFRLGRLHRLLRERGAFEHAELCPGYGAVLAKAASRG